MCAILNSLKRYPTYHRPFSRRLVRYVIQIHAETGYFYLHVFLGDNNVDDYAIYSCVLYIPPTIGKNNKKACTEATPPLWSPLA